MRHGHFPPPHSPRLDRPSLASQTRCMSIVIRPYVERDEQGWLRCRVLSFLDTAFFDSVEREKERYERPAIELVAEDGREIIGLLDVECDSDGLADRPGRGGMSRDLGATTGR